MFYDDYGCVKLLSPCFTLFRAREFVNRWYLLLVVNVPNYRCASVDRTKIRHSSTRRLSREGPKRDLKWVLAISQGKFSFNVDAFITQFTWFTRLEHSQYVVKYTILIISVAKLKNIAIWNRSESLFSK